MGNIQETRSLVHLRRRALLMLHMNPGKDSLEQRSLTKGLRHLGFRADSNSTNADFRWFRKLGMELAPRRSNPAQQDVDKIVEHWKENNS